MSTEEKAQDVADEEREPAKDSKRSDSSSPNEANRIMLIPYPKFIFMYPTLIVSFIAALVLSFTGDQTIDPSVDTLPVIMTGTFLVVMLANMFVLVFDFPRATVLTMIFILTTLGLGCWIFFVSKPDAAPSVGDAVWSIRPAANATFFWCVTIVMAIMYASIFIVVRFDYWELRNNELLHHHGFLSDLKRYPAPNMRVDKEINDVFEYMLLGAGRLILHPSTEKRAIVLDNVLFVGTKEQKLTRMLGAIKVQIRPDQFAS